MKLIVTLLGGLLWLSSAYVYADVTPHVTMPANGLPDFSGTYDVSTLTPLQRR